MLALMHHQHLLGMFLMISANDFMALYMGLELQSLALYILVAFVLTGIVNYKLLSVADPIAARSIKLRRSRTAHSGMMTLM